MEAEGQTCEPGTFWPQFLWVTGVFLNLKLCAFWRSAAHSVHDNFLTIYCGPIKVYIFEVCEDIVSAWIKWFSRRLSFPSQKKKYTNASFRPAEDHWSFHWLFYNQFSGRTSLEASLVIFGRSFWNFFVWKRLRNMGFGDKGFLVQFIQLFFSQTLFDFYRLVSHSTSPKFSGKISYVLGKPRICFLGSKDKQGLF